MAKIIPVARIKMAYDAKAYAKKYRETHKEQRQEWMKSYMQRPEAIEKKQSRMRKFVIAHPEYFYHKDLDAKERNHLKKITVLSHYANPIGIPICDNCGEQDTDVLCLDHIQGGGGKHRKEDYNLFFNLVKGGFPEGYQVLCANCNLKKSRFERGKMGQLNE